MGRPIPVPQRQVIFQRSALGHRAADIADDLGLNPETVRKLISRFRKAGEAGIAPDYSRCGTNQPNRGDAGMIGAATAMRREHPAWGAGIIRVQLAEQHPGRVIPSERAIQRAFARAGLNPAPAGRRRDGPGRRAERPHQTWQMDAADQMKLADGGQASWLRIVDECSGAVLETVVFPPWGAGTPCRRPRPSRPSGTPSVAGDCRPGSAWTTARPGGPRVTCPPTWGSGCPPWASRWWPTRRDARRTTAWSSARRAPASAGPSPTGPPRRRSCRRPSGPWTAGNASPIPIGAGPVAGPPTRAWPIRAARMTDRERGAPVGRAVAGPAGRLRRPPSGRSERDGFGLRAELLRRQGLRRPGRVCEVRPAGPALAVPG
jgi:hypothetical protein